MTGRQWKDLVLGAAATLIVCPYLMDELTEFPGSEVREAVNVLLESLPGIPDSAVEAAMQKAAEYDVEPGMATFDRLHKQFWAAKTDSEYEETQVQIIEQTMSLLAQVSLLDLSPSAHLD